MTTKDSSATDSEYYAEYNEVYGSSLDHYCDKKSVVILSEVLDAQIFSILRNKSFSSLLERKYFSCHHLECVFSFTTR